jgi:glycosyltransferase involved in cell wall biosynthesis
LVNDTLKPETIGNIWEQDAILNERRSPKLRHPLRIAILCMTPDRSGPPEFIVKLATGLGEGGHEVHILTPGGPEITNRPSPNGVHFHGVDIPIEGTLQEIAEAFRIAAEQRLKELPPCDIVHAHEWLAGAGLEMTDCAKICSLTSIETTRRNGTEANAQSTAIEEAERKVATKADVVLVPGWLRDQAIRELRIDAAHVHGFAMEGRLPNEWECSLDFGQVKKDIGLGPMDRLVVFIGPLDYAAGPDLILDALPVVLQRAPDVRVAFAGSGEQYASLHQRARQLGIDYAVRLLGHVDRNRVNKLLRASEALILPSRYRVPFDDAVVDLARLAGRPVVTTHGGPAHLVRHEQTGIVTYDNPGSIVWAFDRILGDPANSRRMGENGRRDDNHTVSWNEVASRYVDLCVHSFPQLSEARNC